MHALLRCPHDLTVTLVPRPASAHFAWRIEPCCVPLPLRLLPLPFLPCRIMNFSTRVIPAGYDFRFGVQTGPS